MYFRHEAGGFYSHQIMTIPAAWSDQYPGFLSAEEVTDLALLVSSDGNAFTAFKPPRKKRRLPSTPGGAAGGRRRTRVDYECSAFAGNRFLKILGNGPTELDRVEIYHPQ